MTNIDKSKNMQPNPYEALALIFKKVAPPSTGCTGTNTEYTNTECDSTVGPTPILSIPPPADIISTEVWNNMQIKIRCDTYECVVAAFDPLNG